MFMVGELHSSKRYGNEVTMPSFTLSGSGDSWKLEKGRKEKLIPADLFPSQQFHAVLGAGTSQYTTASAPV